MEEVAHSGDGVGVLAPDDGGLRLVGQPEEQLGAVKVAEDHVHLAQEHGEHERGGVVGAVGGLARAEDAQQELLGLGELFLAQHDVRQVPGETKHDVGAGVHVFLADTDGVLVEGLGLGEPALALQAHT